jgi:two-component system phosphate regulon response regulator PhoB
LHQPNGEAMSAQTILVVDEDDARRQLNAFGLRCAGFRVEEAEDGSAARSRIAQHFPQLVLIIAALLDFSIQDFVRTLRSTAYTRDLPIMTLVERETELGSGAALAWGIDDYLVEPISPEGFVERVRASLEAASAAARESVVDLRVDSEHGLARRGTRAVALGPTERRLLEFFLAHPEQVIPRDLLLFRIWGGARNLQSRVLDVSVCRLRRALRELGCANPLQTVSRRGYRFASTE